MDHISTELLVDGRYLIGEGPVWDTIQQELFWVDIPLGAIHRLDPRSATVKSRKLDQPVGSIALRRGGGLVAALRDGFGFVSDTATEKMEVILVEAASTANRMNDGKCDCRGRFWAGTMAVDHLPAAGTLYRLDRHDDAWRVSAILPGITIANGLDWSPDNRLMYYIDSQTRRIDVFDFDTDYGLIANRRPFVEISETDGMPDGMTVDAEGCIWVALFYGGKVRRYAPDGRPIMEIHLPVSLVTSCAFGGENFDELYITTARHRLTPAQAAEQTHAGSLFVCRPGPLGRASYRFDQ